MLFWALCYTYGVISEHLGFLLMTKSWALLILLWSACFYNWRTSYGLGGQMGFGVIQFLWFIWIPAHCIPGFLGLSFGGCQQGLFQLQRLWVCELNPSARLGSFSAGRSRMCWQKNLLTCRRLVIFRFREKTLKNLSPQPVFPFPPSLLSPPSH